MNSSPEHLLTALYDQFVSLIPGVRPEILTGHWDRYPRTKYRIYGVFDTASAYPCFILKCNLLSLYPMHPTPTITLVWFWDVLNTCFSPALSWTLHCWRTDFLRTSPVQWAISVAFWTSFLWAVSLALQTWKISFLIASTPQQRQRDIYCACKMCLRVDRTPCKKRDLHLQLCICST